MVGSDRRPVEMRGWPEMRGKGCPARRQSLASVCPPERGLSFPAATVAGRRALYLPPLRKHLSLSPTPEPPPIKFTSLSPTLPGLARHRRSSASSRRPGPLTVAEGPPPDARTGVFIAPSAASQPHTKPSDKSGNCDWLALMNKEPCRGKRTLLAPRTPATAGHPISAPERAPARSNTNRAR